MPTGSFSKAVRSAAAPPDAVASQPTALPSDLGRHSRRSRHLDLLLPLTAIGAPAPKTGGRPIPGSGTSGGPPRTRPGMTQTVRELPGNSWTSLLPRHASRCTKHAC
eukprot:scaffold63_cov306-Pinguiococcus_pyrenoidosus.AAC.61